MDSQLQQLIAVQAEQNRLLKNQLQWLRFRLITLSLLVTASLLCLGFLIHERSTTAGKLTVVTTEPILEHPISVTETEPAQIQFPVRFAENDAAPLDTIPPSFGKRITVPPMAKAVSATQTDFGFPAGAVARPGRGCDGMCL